ncbi:hypothetical protein BDK51DRAFT_44563 [Blyttiomyces helicus]|uniref:Uncharacterized protein n=1 Tax=Blyttiomyces helicus TaxID=388810 RepID=A0A4P9WG87_9FUNG|nr:hypothetical protein BDK51DRAFT_44563 [Blyttiomyces helicus]|eukprot:RKO90040.1 hypothetical protein BDK51DRAFT_44563 [Blyttiomyces helicus]
MPISGLPIQAAIDVFGHHGVGRFKRTSLLTKIRSLYELTVFFLSSKFPYLTENDVTHLFHVQEVCLRTYRMQKCISTKSAVKERSSLPDLFMRSDETTTCNPGSGDYHLLLHYAPPADSKGLQHCGRKRFVATCQTSPFRPPLNWVDHRIVSGGGAREQRRPARHVAYPGFTRGAAQRDGPHRAPLPKFPVPVCLRISHMVADPMDSKNSIGLLPQVRPLLPPVGISEGSCDPGLTDTLDAPKKTQVKTDLLAFHAPRTVRVGDSRLGACWRALSLAGLVFAAWAVLDDGVVLRSWDIESGPLEATVIPAPPSNPPPYCVPPAPLPCAYLDPTQMPGAATPPLLVTTRLAVSRTAPPVPGCDPQIPLAQECRVGGVDGDVVSYFVAGIERMSLVIQHSARFGGASNPLFTSVAIPAGSKSLMDPSGALIPNAISGGPENEDVIPISSILRAAGITLDNLSTPLDGVNQSMRFAGVAVLVDIEYTARALPAHHPRTTQLATFNESTSEYTVHDHYGLSITFSRTGAVTRATPARVLIALAAVGVAVQCAFRVVFSVVVWCLPGRRSNYELIYGASSTSTTKRAPEAQEVTLSNLSPDWAPKPCSRPNPCACAACRQTLDSFPYAHSASNNPSMATVVPPAKHHAQNNHIDTVIDVRTLRNPAPSGTLPFPTPFPSVSTTMELRPAAPAGGPPTPFPSPQQHPTDAGWWRSGRAVVDPSAPRPSVLTLREEEAAAVGLREGWQGRASVGAAAARPSVGPKNEGKVPPNLAPLHVQIRYPISPVLVSPPSPFRRLPPSQQNMNPLSLLPLALLALGSAGALDTRGAPPSEVTLDSVDPQLFTETTYNIL